MFFRKLHSFLLYFIGGVFMATTRLMPLHTGKGRDVGTAISDIIDYAENPEKTDYGRLITGYECDSRTADAEFLFSTISVSPLSPVRSRRMKRTGSDVSLPNVLRTGTMLSSSAPTLTNTTFIIISSGIPHPLTAL